MLVSSAAERYEVPSKVYPLKGTGYPYVQSSTVMLSIVDELSPFNGGTGLNDIIEHELICSVVGISIVG